MKKGFVRSICIIANGEKPERSVLEKALSSVDLVIAVDGGSLYCMEMNISPDVIIGDFDSSTDHDRKFFRNSEILHLEDQETSDMEKAINYASSYQPERINIISALGKRTDHLLANINLFYHLYKFNKLKDVDVHVYDNWGEMRFLKPGKYIISNRIGKTVSFLSFDNITNLTLKGFRYNLERHESQGYFSGLSNVYDSDECVVEFQGNILIWYECYEIQGENINEQR